MRKILLLLSILILSSCQERQRFKIKIIFCDDRDPVVTTTDVRKDRRPSVYDINNMAYISGRSGRMSRHTHYYPGVAVPEYTTYEYIPSGSTIKADNFKTKKYLNVCDIEVLN